MCKIRFRLKQNFPRSGIFKIEDWKSIDDVDSCGKSIRLVGWR